MVRPLAALLVAALSAGCTLPEIAKDPASPTTVLTPPTSDAGTGDPPVATPTTPAGPETLRRVVASIERDAAAEGFIVLVVLEGTQGTPFLLPGVLNLTWTDAFGVELRKTSQTVAFEEFIPVRRNGVDTVGLRIEAPDAGFNKTRAYSGSRVDLQVAYDPEEERVFRVRVSTDLPETLLDTTPDRMEVGASADESARTLVLRVSFTREYSPVDPSGNATVAIVDEDGRTLEAFPWTFAARPSNPRAPFGGREGFERIVPYSDLDKSFAAGGLDIYVNATVEGRVFRGVANIYSVEGISAGLPERVRFEALAQGVLNGKPYLDLRLTNIGPTPLSFCSECLEAHVAAGYRYAWSENPEIAPTTLDPDASYRWRAFFRAPDTARFDAVYYVSGDEEIRANVPTP